MKIILYQNSTVLVIDDIEVFHPVFIQPFVSRSDKEKGIPAASEMVTLELTLPPSINQEQVYLVDKNLAFVPIQSQTSSLASPVLRVELSRPDLNVALGNGLQVLYFEISQLTWKIQYKAKLDQEADFVDFDASIRIENGDTRDFGPAEWQVVVGHLPGDSLSDPNQGMNQYRLSSSVESRPLGGSRRASAAARPLPQREEDAPTMMMESMPSMSSYQKPPKRGFSGQRSGGQSYALTLPRQISVKRTTATLIPLLSLDHLPIRKHYYFDVRTTGAKSQAVSVDYRFKVGEAKEVGEAKIHKTKGREQGTDTQELVLPGGDLQLFSKDLKHMGTFPLTSNIGMGSEVTLKDQKDDHVRIIAGFTAQYVNTKKSSQQSYAGGVMLDNLYETKTIQKIHLYVNIQETVISLPSPPPPGIEKWTHDPVHNRVDMLLINLRPKENRQVKFQFQGELLLLE